MLATRREEALDAAGTRAAIQALSATLIGNKQTPRRDRSGDDDRRDGLSIGQELVESSLKVFDCSGVDFDQEAVFAADAMAPGYLGLFLWPVRRSWEVARRMGGRGRMR